MKVTETAVRQELRTLTLLAGGTGSGKTESAMRLATGLAGGAKFAVIDTENGRALHKADDYSFAHVALGEPFTPERYIEAMEAVADYPVIVIDSGSHEYDGPGGVLDLQADEFKRMGEREGARMSSWIEPKRRHKRFVQALLRSPAHVILCLRAEDKIEVVKVDGKTVVRPKETLTGAQGWVPIVEKRLPFEATISLLLLQDNAGVPVPIKLEARHRTLIPLDRPLDESVGAALAAWARGTASGAEPSPTAAHPAEGAGGSGKEPAPSASEDPESPASPPSSDGETPVGGSGPSHAENIAALDALVTSLAETNTVTKRQVWVAVARMRSKPVDDLIDLYDGKGEDGDVHWSPLRQILRPEEAVELRKRLGAKWAESREAVPA